MYVNICMLKMRICGYGVFLTIVENVNEFVRTRKEANTNTDKKVLIYCLFYDDNT